MSSPFFTTRTHVLPGQHIREYPGATLDDPEDPLRLHIKQYIPRIQVDITSVAVTIIGAHANGFPKVSSIEFVSFYYVRWGSDFLVGAL